jgi:hypothetical protein
LIQDTVSQNQIDLDINELFTINLLSEVQLQSQVNATVDSFKNSMVTRFVSFLNYLRISIRANFLVSALNTNLLINHNWGITNFIYSSEIYYGSGSLFDGSYFSDSSGCGGSNPTSPAIFSSLINVTPGDIYALWTPPEPNSTFISGFFEGCTALEALLQSSLDCLYDTECLQLMVDYFPALNQV